MRDASERREEQPLRSTIQAHSGRRAFPDRCEGGPARASGAQGRENVGTSNRTSCESQDRRKPKGSLAMTIIQG